MPWKHSPKSLKQNRLMTCLLLHLLLQICGGGRGETSPGSVEFPWPGLIQSSLSVQESRKLFKFFLQILVILYWGYFSWFSLNLMETKNIIHSHVHSFATSPVCSFVHSIICSFILSFLRSSVVSCVPLYIYAHARTYVRQFVIRSFVHFPFTYLKRTGASEWGLVDPIFHFRLRQRSWC